MKRFTIIFLLLITVFFAQLTSSETVTITDCDDITLLKDAYANNKLDVACYKPADYPQLMINMFKC